MKLDHEHQRIQLLELIRCATFTGEALDMALALREAVRHAEIEPLPHEQRGGDVG